MGHCSIITYLGHRHYIMVSTLQIKTSQHLILKVIEAKSDNNTHRLCSRIPNNMKLQIHLKVFLFGNFGCQRGMKETESKCPCPVQFIISSRYNVQSCQFCERVRVLYVAQMPEQRRLPYKTSKYYMKTTCNVN